MEFKNMFTYKLVCSLRVALVSTVFTRNKGTGKGTVTDPVQQLFLDKLREYRTKSPNDEIVDPSPAILKELKKELDKLDKNYGADKGVDMTAFPAFKFEEPKIDSIDEAVPEKEKKNKKRGAVKKKVPVKGAAAIMAKTGKNEDPKK